MSKMSSDLQYTLQDAMWQEYPLLLKGSRYIKQAAGIKFWAIDPHGESSESLRYRIQLHLRKKHNLDEGLVTVQVGVSYRGAPPSLVIRLSDATPLRMEVFGKGDFQRAPELVPAPPLKAKGTKSKIVNVPLSVQTLKRWQSALSMLRTEVGNTTLQQCADVEEEMKTIIKVASGKL